MPTAVPFSDNAQAEGKHLPHRASDMTVPDVPAWARRAAAAVVWVSLPSVVWRLAAVLGVPLGLGQSEYDAMLLPGWGLLVLPLLSLAQEGLAWLTLGLVRPWGEVWPRWLPYLGGRPVPVRAAVIPAAFGTLACSVYGVLLVWTTLHAQMDITPWGNWLLTACYLPVAAWGPLLGVVTVHYYRRRTRG
ncbi:hypothetical protein [Streptomyces europaeiscabiei]|uniref:hypothetical protein n=1 Tax=Streptomyces europaeiscabiei TaxID=146819 RepID=UPI002E27FED8|nr:hypothetical protein [Streptomyces europaeiscabiei]